MMNLTLYTALFQIARQIALPGTDDEPHADLHRHHARRETVPQPRLPWLPLLLSPRRAAARSYECAQSYECADARRADARRADARRADARRADARRADA